MLFACLDLLKSLLLLLGAVEDKVGHVPVTSSLQLDNVLSLAWRHRVIVKAQPVVWGGARGTKQQEGLENARC